MNRIDEILNGHSPSPGWPPPPPPPPTPQEVEVERDRLRELKAALPAASRGLEAAVEGLVGLSVAEASFTSFTYSLALAYNEVEAYTRRELRQRAEDTAEIGDRAGRSADVWEAAERASAPRVV
ncbi:type VII secretion target [Spirillospora sp. NPDC029432]|uniref:type VII secretion target n=1 Tax=Spirillospora sp. NPDC029432 TaxID=3154599 RepID=UPI003454246A